MKLLHVLLALLLSTPALLFAQTKVYYINPVSGNDGNNGLSARHAWKSFKKMEKMVFRAGDSIKVMAPGIINGSLVLHAEGDSAAPVTVYFAPGRYDFYPEQAYKTLLNISNTNDTPLMPKAIALYCRQSRYVHIVSDSALIVLRGKMIETCIDHSEHISINGLIFDYQRPTVSELKVISATDQFAEVAVHRDSRYTISDSVLTWEGEGWRYQPGWYWQVFDPGSGYVMRTDLSLKGLKYVETSPYHVRIYYPRNPGFKPGCTYQNRDVTRDCAGIFIQRSKDIRLENVSIRFMHGMGIVSQFSENLSFHGLKIAPAENSGRTCAAWADILHFSGCKGLIDISDCLLSAANDDAINIHGTHLRIISSPRPDQLLVRFMHNQTYGFDAFQPGDSIDFIHASTLLPYHAALIKSTQKLNDKDFLLTLNGPVPATLQPEDVVENTTWTPTVWIHYNFITAIPTRGILITTRRKVIIEKNVLQKIASSAILVADDAESWYESGMVNALTIRNNNFVLCGEPVINIHPENKVYAAPVHQHINIRDNRFELQTNRLLDVKSTDDLIFLRNKIYTATPADLNTFIHLQDCTGVKLEDNQIQQR